MNKGIGPRGTSLLKKLGLTPITEMSDDELRTLVMKDRERRSQVRTEGRVRRAAQEKKSPKSSRVPTLESLGLSPRIIETLRASGKTDVELLTELRQKGLI